MIGWETSLMVGEELQTTKIIRDYWNERIGLNLYMGLFQCYFCMLTGNFATLHVQDRTYINKHLIEILSL